jgi:hypothetical protein
MSGWKNLGTVARVIDAFGGTAACARYTQSGMAAVSNWKRRGQIPAKWRLPMQEYLRERGYRFDPALWGENKQLQLKPKRLKRKQKSAS